MRIVVFGAGYVGCVTCACLAKLGHHVSIVDTEPSKIEAIRCGQTPVLEQDLDQLIAEGVANGSLHGEHEVAQSLVHADLAIVCVGTPSLKNGLIDTSSLQRVLQSIACLAIDRTSPIPVVIRFTILAPALRRVLANIQPVTAQEMIQVVLNPEFLRETSAVADFFHPPFIVVGGDSRTAINATLRLYEGVEAPRYEVDLETASMLKYACNAFHALKITFANEIDTLAGLIGANGREVMRLLTQDSTLNISPAYLRPGFAFGGSCLAKDLRAMEALAREHHEPLCLLSSIRASNQHRMGQAFETIMSNPARRLAFIGLSFKTGTDDLRESPYLELAERLLGKGFEIKVYDPDLDTQRLVGSNLAHVIERLPHLVRMLVRSPREACDGVEAVVLCKRLLSLEALRAVCPDGLLIYDLDHPTTAMGLLGGLVRVAPTQLSEATNGE